MYVIFFYYLCNVFRMNTNREIVRLAIPSILANITIPLVGIVDTAIVGHISNASAIGGLAIGTMLFDLLYWNFGFLRIGTSGLTAQAYGSGNRTECLRLLRQSISIAMAASAAIWLVQWLFVTLVLAVVPCSPEVSEVAKTYFYIRIWAAPATLSLMAFKGWFIGMQDTRSPMAVDIWVNAVNMLASYLLAVNAGLGVAGVAWGTLIAQYSGLLLALLILIVRYQFGRGLQQLRDAATATRSDWHTYFRFNGNLFIRSLCFMVVYVGFTSLASRYGDTELAVSSLLMKLFLFFSYFVDGFAYAGEALVGKAYGELKVNAKADVSDVVHKLFGWSVGVGVLFTIVYTVWGDECLSLLTNDNVVLAACNQYLGWLIAMPIVSTLAFMWDGVYTGATAGREIRNAMILAAVAFVAGYASSYRFVGAQALYIGYFAHLLARVVYLSMKWKKVSYSTH